MKSILRDGKEGSDFEYEEILCNAKLKESIVIRPQIRKQKK